MRPKGKAHEMQCTLVIISAQTFNLVFTVLTYLHFFKREEQISLRYNYHTCLFYMSTGISQRQLWSFV